MKKIGYLACLVVGLMFLVNAQSYAKDPDEEVSGLLQRIILLSAKMHQQGYTIVHIEVDKLEQGQKYMTSRRLFNDNHYKIAGIGGVGISDLDIKLYDSNNNLIDEDTSTDNIPEVYVSPRWSGDFFIRTSFHSLSRGYPTNSEYFFCYMVGFKRR